MDAELAGILNDTSSGVAEKTMKIGALALQRELDWRATAPARSAEQDRMFRVMSGRLLDDPVVVTELDALYIHCVCRALEVFLPDVRASYSWDGVTPTTRTLSAVEYEIHGFARRLFEHIKPTLGRQKS